MELVIKIENLEQARAVASFLPVFLGYGGAPSLREPQNVFGGNPCQAPELFRLSAATVTQTPDGQHAAASTATLSTEEMKKQVAASAEKPTPLEAAFAASKTERVEADVHAGLDPFAQLQAGTEAQPEAPAEKPRKERKKKAEPEAEKPADKPLDLDGVKKASTIALELVGAVVIQEALAKFNAVDDKKVLRTSALRPQDYELYVGYLKKKANDAAKEWPADEAKFLAESAARRAAANG